MTAVDSSSVRNYLLGLQERITSALEQVEGPQGARFVRDAWANSKHGRPYPGYDTALVELTKDL